MAIEILSTDHVTWQYKIQGKCPICNCKLSFFKGDLRTINSRPVIRCPVCASLLDCNLNFVSDGIEEYVNLFQYK